MKWARSGPGMPCVHDSFLFAFIYSLTFFFFFFFWTGEARNGFKRFNAATPLLF